MLRPAQFTAALLLALAATPDSAAAQTDLYQSIGRLSDGTGIAADRKALHESGLSYALVYTNAVLGNLSGGLQRTAIYEGKLEASLSMDFEKLARLEGWSGYVNLFQLHHTRGMRDDVFNAVVTVSNIEAVPATRLQEYWLERKFSGDRFSIRFGQLAADSEFFISNYSVSLVTSDWPAITTANLPAGGPAYPLATPGIRFRFDPNPQWSALFAIFDGDPGDQATINRTGTRFAVKDPPLALAELQYRYNQDKDASGLAGILRAGGWYYFGNFNDQRFDTQGFSLANPLSNGLPRQLRGTSGIYGIVDQQLYRPKGGGADSGIGFFSRVSISPSDRSVIDFYLDGGLIFSGLHRARPDDKISAGFIYAKYSGRIAELDRDLIQFSGMARPLRDYELIAEVNYLFLVRQGWAVQPLFQYLVHPGGNIPNPANPSQPIRGGAIIGVRSTMAY